MKFVRTWILMTSLTATIASCQKASESSEPNATHGSRRGSIEEQNAVSISLKEKTQLSHDLANLSEFETELNRFTVQISFPTRFSKTLRIERLDRTKNETRVLPIENSEDSQSDETTHIEDHLDLTSSPLMRHDVLYTIILGEKELARKEFRLLPDLIVRGTRRLSDFGLTAGSYSFGTAFIDQNSQLITEGLPIELKAERLISLRATIETFDEKEALKPSADETIGRNGGLIQIKASEAQGELNIYLRGTKGGKGKAGLAATGQGNPGQNGRPGKRAIQSTTCTHGTRGSSGGVGPKGDKGLKGARGGNSGSLEMWVGKSTAFNIKVYSMPGIGGDGGAGGRGGPGGRGGESGYKCRHGKDNDPPRFPPGPQGPDGPQGDQGDEGNPGEKEGICVVFAPEVNCKIRTEY